MLEDLLKLTISVIGGFSAMTIILELLIFGIYKAFLLLNIVNS